MSNAEIQFWSSDMPPKNNSVASEVNFSTQGVLYADLVNYVNSLSKDSTPSLVPVGTVFIVPTNRQYGFRYPIVLDGGVLRLDGVLYEV